MTQKFSKRQLSSTIIIGGLLVATVIALPQTRNLITGRAFNGVSLVNPTSINTGVNETFSYSLGLTNTQNRQIRMVDIGLRFPNQDLELVSITPASDSLFSLFLPSINNGSFDSTTVISRANQSGEIRFAATTFDWLNNELTNPVTSTTNLASLQFRALNPGTHLIQYISQNTLAATTSNPPQSTINSTDMRQTSVQVSNTQPSSTPQPTQTPVPTSPPQTGTTTLNFNSPSLTDQELNGLDSSGLVNWGNTSWMVSSPWGGFNTNNLGLRNENITTATIRVTNTTSILQSFQITTGGNLTATISLECSGNPSLTRTVNPNQVVSVNTGWTTHCQTITYTSSVGWDATLDNLVFGSSVTPPPVTTVAPNPTSTPRPSPTPIVVPGSQNRSLDFDGVNDRVTATVLPQLTTFTAEAWVRLDGSVNNYQSFLGNANSNYSENSFTLFIDPGSDCPTPNQFAYFQRAGNYTVCSGTSLQPNTWYHLAVSRNQNGVVRMFVNGQLAASRSISTNPSTSSAPLTIGSAGTYDSEYFQGLIDEVRISTSTRYNSSFSPNRNLSPDNTTWALYKFNETSGQTILDSSSNQRNGFLGIDSAADSSDPSRSTTTP